MLNSGEALDRPDTPDEVVTAVRRLPAVEAHLRCCGDCREEYQALLCILRAEIDGQLQNLDYSTQKDS